MFEGPRGVGKGHLLHAAHATAATTLAAHHGLVVETTGPRMWPTLLGAVVKALTAPQHAQLCERLYAEAPYWQSVLARSGLSGALLALCSSMASSSPGHGGWAAQPLQVEGRTRSVQRLHTHPLPSKLHELCHVLLHLGEAALALLNAPVVVVARDLDAADHDSQALLLHLLQGDRPLLLLASMHASGDVGHLRAQLVALPHVSLVALPPLSHHDTQQLMQVC